MNDVERAPQQLRTIVGVGHDVRVHHSLTWIDFHRFLYRIQGPSIKDFFLPQEFLVSEDKKTVKQELDPPIVARFLRIYPRDYHRFRTLRLELYGCTSGQ